MSRSRKPRPPSWAPPLCVALLWTILRLALPAVLAPATAVAAPPAAALLNDSLTLRDGSTFRCRVMEVDARRVLVEREDGRQSSIPRPDVVRIEFGLAPPPPIVARVHVDEADDIVRIKLDGKEVAPPATLRAGWFDLVPLLRDGPNVVEAEVENRSGSWAYRWVIEAGSQKEVFACGLAGRAGCRDDGREGHERGTFPAGRIYLYVHRDAGEVTLQR
jgi:hypothetical protein